MKKASNAPEPKKRGPNISNARLARPLGETSTGGQAHETSWDRQDKSRRDQPCCAVSEDRAHPSEAAVQFSFTTLEQYQVEEPFLGPSQRADDICNFDGRSISLGDNLRNRD